MNKEKRIYQFAYIVLDILNQFSEVEWIITSVVRDANTGLSHAECKAVDYAPKHFIDYAVTHNRSPLLMLRRPLINWLWTLAPYITQRIPDRSIAVFLEDDHLHVHFYEPDYGVNRPRFKVSRLMKTRDDIYDNSYVDFVKLRDTDGTYSDFQRHRNLF